MQTPRPASSADTREIALRCAALETAVIALARCLHRDRPGLLQRTLAEMDLIASEAHLDVVEPQADQAVRFNHAREVIRDALRRTEGNE